MDANKHPTAQTERKAHLEALLRQLSEAERALQALRSVAGAPVSPSAHETPPGARQAETGRQWGQEVRETATSAIAALQAAQETLRQQSKDLITDHNDLETVQQQCQELFESAFHGYLVTDLNGVIQQANQAANTLLGASVATLGGHPLTHYVIADDQDDFHRRLEQARMKSPHDSVQWETHMTRRISDIEDVTFRAAITLSPIHDRTGAQIGLRWLLRDISSSTRVEEREQFLFEARAAASEAQVANRLLRTLLDTMPVGIIVCDAGGAVLMTNAPGQEILGSNVAGDMRDPRRSYTPYRPDGAFFPQEEMPLVRAMTRGETTESSEILIRREDGSTRALLAKAAPVRDSAGQIVSGVAVFQDITSRRQAEEEIRRLVESVERERTLLETIMENTHAHLAYLDTDFNFVMVNSAYAEGAGYSKDALVGQNHFALFPNAENQAIFERVRETGALAKFQARPFRFENRPQRGDTYWDWTLAPVKENSVLQGLVLSLVDVTEMVHAQQVLRDYAEKLEQQVERRTNALRTSHARFQAIFQDSAIGIALIDDQGCIVTSNPALQEILGYPEDELAGIPLARLTQSERDTNDMDLYCELIAGKRDHYQWEGQYTRKDGAEIYANTTVSLASRQDQEARFAVVMVEDITERKQAQIALMQSEKLALTGRLAATLAHEINNPLQSVIGFMSLAWELLEEDADPEMTNQYLQIAIEEVKRAASIVTQMRDLNRKTAPSERQPEDVNALVERTLTLCQRKLEKQEVALTWQPSGELPTVPMSRDRIQQVFLNLMFNALDAMPDGGTLHISTAPTSAPQGVWIRFTDTGTGIPAGEIPHLFEPFHTTKETGVGLGLYVSQTIIGEHKGEITVESVEGKGATFTVWLPV
ncbi:MAG: PAS domain S-box protein [Anaerolineae bacterium]|nr:PAS domain S-box protein [Anaerolineae bacterium]